MYPVATFNLAAMLLPIPWAPRACLCAYGAFGDVRNTRSTVGNGAVQIARPIYRDKVMALACDESDPKVSQQPGKSYSCFAAWVRKCSEISIRQDLSKQEGRRLLVMVVDPATQFSGSSANPTVISGPDYASQFSNPAGISDRDSRRPAGNCIVELDAQLIDLPKTKL